MIQIKAQMNKFHILVIVLFGFLLMPSNSFACGNSSNKHSCKKEVSSKTDKEDCCKGDSHSKGKNSDGCAGKCGHSKCGCPATSNGFTIVYEIKFKNNTFDFSSEKQKNSHSETFISSGFYSIWLIPKIS